MLRVAVLGASGRMGRAVLRCLDRSEDFRLTGAVTESTDPALGRDAGEVCALRPLDVVLTDDPAQGLRDAQAAVDFTVPAAAAANVAAAVARGVALAVGTTGLESEQLAALEAGAKHIPVVYARNMSVGMAVFKDLVGRAAAALDEEYDIEIVDAHHGEKVDAPSGTALELGERAAEARGRPLEAVAVYGRQGRTGPPGARRRGLLRHPRRPYRRRPQRPVRRGGGADRIGTPGGRTDGFCTRRAARGPLGRRTPPGTLFHGGCSRVALSTAGP